MASVSGTSGKFPVPPGLPELLQDFTRAVLRDQPAKEDLVRYAAAYFRNLSRNGVVDGEDDEEDDDDDDDDSAMQEEEDECAKELERKGRSAASAGVDEKLSGGLSVVGTRHPQCEDIHTLVERGVEGRFFVVCDGHGGAGVSKFVARVFVNELLSTPEWVAGETKDALKEACYRVELRLKNERGCQPQHNGEKDSDKGTPQGNSDAWNAGCCTVCAVIQQGIVYVANVGDSRCILVQRKRGAMDKASRTRPAAVIALSKDHKPIEISERKRLSDDGVMVHGGRVLAMLAVSRSFGDLCIKSLCEKGVICEPEITVRKLSAADDELEDVALVLGSDGIWDVLTNEQVGSLVLQYLENFDGSCESAASSIVQEAMRRGSQDDITALVVKL